MVEHIRWAVGENHSVDNIALEINSTKFAHNLSFVDCAHFLLPR
jgi:hypothetical protein